MCFVDDPEPQTSTPPPQVLEQATPDKKKTAVSRSDALAIGTKKYRAETGLGTPKAPAAPTGIRLT